MAQKTTINCFNKEKKLINNVNVTKNDGRKENHILLMAEDEPRACYLLFFLINSGQEFIVDAALRPYRVEVEWKTPCGVEFKEILNTSDCAIEQALVEIDNINLYFINISTEFDIDETPRTPPSRLESHPQPGRALVSITAAVNNETGALETDQ